MSDDKYKTNGNKDSSKKKALSREEYTKKIEEQKEKFGFFDKLKIIFSSFKWQAIIFLIFVFFVPFLLSGLFIFTITEYSYLIDIFKNTPWYDFFNSKESILTFIRDVWSTYLIIINFGWIFSFFDYSPIQFASMFKDNISAIIYTVTFYVFLTLTIFNFISVLVIKKFKLSKKGNNELSELTKKLRKTYAQAHTMKSTHEKKKYEKVLSSIKKSIIENLKILVRENQKKDDPNKIYYLSSPIFKIMTDKIDSMSAGMIAGLTNKYWQKIITKQQIIESWEEVLDFLFKWQFNGNQMEFIEKLNIINNPKYGIDPIKFCNYGKKDEKNQYTFEEQRKNCMKIMCVAAYFKNYPKDPFFSFFEKFNIVFDTYERKLIKNSNNWIMGIENDKIPSILPMALLLPKMNDLDSTFKLSKLVYETLGDLTNKMPLLQNQAIEDKGYSEQTPYKITYKVLEDLIVSKTMEFIELLFFNIFIDFTQTKKIRTRNGSKEINAWNNFLIKVIKDIQKRGNFKPEEKKEIETLIRKGLTQKVQGLSLNYHTNQISQPIDAEIQVAKLKRLIGIELFLDFYRDFLKNTNRIFFFRREHLDWKQNDDLSDLHNTLLKQLMNYYEYYYEYLNIYENIRMKN